MKCLLEANFVFSVKPTIVGYCFVKWILFSAYSIFWEKFRFLGKLPTQSSPNSTLTFASHLGQNIGLGEG